MSYEWAKGNLDRLNRENEKRKQELERQAQTQQLQAQAINELQNRLNELEIEHDARRSREKNKTITDFG